MTATWKVSSVTGTGRLFDTLLLISITPGCVDIRESSHAMFIVELWSTMEVGPDGGNAEANSHSSSAAGAAAKVEGSEEIKGAVV